MDDLLTPEEIEALMSAARGAPAPADAGAAAKPPAAKPAPPPPPRKPESQPEQLLNQAQKQLAAAMSPSPPRSSVPNIDAANPFNFEDFGRTNGSHPSVEFPITALQDVELDLRIELGRTELLIEEILQLREGTVVPLDKLAGDPVDILVNGRLIGRGEVLVLNDNFCVRVAEILSPND